MSVNEVLSMKTEADISEKWERLDDVIMGGQSRSKLQAAADGSGAVWRGDLILEVSNWRRGMNGLLTVALQESGQQRENCFR